MFYAYRDLLTQLYSVTYMYYSFIGCAITVIVGWTVSYFTGSESDLYDQKLIHPWARKMADLFPGKKRRYMEKTLTPDDKVRNATSNSLHVQTVDKRMATSSSNPAFVQDTPADEMNGVYQTKL